MLVFVRVVTLLAEWVTTIVPPEIAAPDESRSSPLSVARSTWATATAAMPSTTAHAARIRFIESSSRRAWTPIRSLSGPDIRKAPV